MHKVFYNFMSIHEKNAFINSSVHSLAPARVLHKGDLAVPPTHRDPLLINGVREPDGHGVRQAAGRGGTQGRRRLRGHSASREGKCVCVGVGVWVCGCVCGCGCGCKTLTWCQVITHPLCAYKKSH